MKALFTSVLFLLFFLLLLNNSSVAQVDVSTGGAPTTYTTLKSAFDAINTGAHTGAIQISLTANTVETATAALNASGSGAASYTAITIKPTTLVSVSGSVAGPIINLNGADNVTIDGRVLVSGAQIDLTIQNINTGTTAHTIQFVEGATNNIVQYCNIVNAGAAIAGGPRPLNFSTSTLVEGNSNNQIIGCIVDGGRIAIQLNGTTANTNKNNIIRKCVVKNWGNLGINFSTATENATADSNLIYFDNPGINTFTSLSGIVVSTTGGGIINITNNKVYDFLTATTSNFSVRGINITPMAGAVVNIHNNFVSFTMDYVNATSIYAISLTGVNSYTANVYYNSTRIGGTGLHPTLTAGTIGTTGIIRANTTGTTSVYNQKNNISLNERTGGVAGVIHSGGFMLNPTVGTLDVDYNLYWATDPVSGAHGGWNSGYNNLDTLKFYASPHEANSIFKAATFLSNIDLHLVGAALGDMDFAATPIAGITTDIDGNTRDLLLPYKGADEAPVLIPVELVSFVANAVNGSVQLLWKTATEVNNQGFEVQRRSGDEFVKIGFVAGFGTTTEPRTYSFVDENTTSGKVSYRLKQIDFDGSFSYSNIVEVDVTTPLNFELAQNYPNPFNPTTVINFQIALPVNVNLTVFNMLGEEVANLINNQFTDAGHYSINFDGSNLASGAYIYRLTAGGFVQTKKMILTK